MQTLEKLFGAESALSNESDIEFTFCEREIYQIKWKGKT